MEETLLNGYLKYRKNVRKKLYKNLYKAPKLILVLMVLLMIISVCLVIFSFTSPLSILYWCTTALDVILFVVNGFLVERYEIKTSDVRLKREKEYSDKMYAWLKEINFNATVENIADLKRRLLTMYQKKEEQLQKWTTRIEKWLQILVVPVVLAIFAEAIKNNTEITSLILYAVTTVLSLVGFALCIFYIYLVAKCFFVRKAKQIKCFADDLQKVLDTQFEDSMILPEKESEDTEG